MAMRSTGLAHGSQGGAAAYNAHKFAEHQTHQQYINKTFAINSYINYFIPVLIMINLWYISN